MKRSAIAFVLAAVVIGGLCAFAVFETVYGDGRCGSCHGGELMEASKRSAHASVECLSCHTSGTSLGRASFALGHVPRLIPSINLPTRDLSDIQDRRCRECHDTIDTDVSVANGIRIDHAVCATESRCTQCHSTTAHGAAVSWVRTYDMEVCLGCHASEGPADCGQCHEGRPREDRITTGVFGVTHGPDWKKTHGMGSSASCSACHTAANCGTCHGPGLPHDDAFMDVHGTVSKRAEAKCESCHERRFCDGCHGLSMPHSRSFVLGHGADAESDRALCDRCHAESDCAICHEKHVHPGGAIRLSEGGGTR